MQIGLLEDAWLSNNYILVLFPLNALQHDEDQWEMFDRVTVETKHKNLGLMIKFTVSINCALYRSDNARESVERVWKYYYCSKS